MANTKTLNNLMTTIAQLEDAKQAQDFFTDLCSRKELEAMADRWTVAPYLDQGYSYREIHDITSISLTTIGRVANALRFGANGYQRMLKRSKQH